MKKRFLSIFLAFVIIFSFFGTGAYAAELHTVAILYTNDVHCAVDANIGYAGLAAYKKEMTAQYGTNNVVLVDAGDSIQGAPIGTLSKGEYLVDIMNFIGYDFTTYGNHEFDYGMEQLKALSAKAKYTYLSCNFMDLKQNKPVLDSYKVVTYGDISIGYIGITTPESYTKSTPAYFQDSTGKYIYGFCEGNNGQDLYNTVQASIDAAKAAGADYIIAIAHLGTDVQSKPWTSSEVAANTRGIDVIIDGHSHSTVETAVVSDLDKENVIITQTGTGLKNIGKLLISNDGTITTSLVSGYTNKDADTNAYIKNIQSQYNTLLKKVVAHTDYNLTIQNPITKKRAVRNSETNLGDLCADAYRWALSADIAFINGGGVRADISAGDITYEQILNVHPFGNMACLVEATGQEIIDALEMASRTAPGENGGFLQVSGLKYTVDTTKPSTVVVDEKNIFVSVSGDRRVKDVLVLNKETGKYSPIDLNRTYTLASHNYMLKSGGDGINMFMNNKLLMDEVLIDNQVLIKYIVEGLGGTVGEAYANPYGQGRATIICNHQYAETAVAATCTAPGSITKVCKLCGHAEVTEIPAIGHTFKDGVCTVCKAADPNYKSPATGDNTNLFPYAVIAFIAIAGAAVIVITKKRKSHID